MPKKIHFWFEFASTYSYLSVMRIDALAQKSNIDVEWHPFLLGPIFSKQGWKSSPFKEYPAKGRYMWRDVERQCEKYKLPFLPVNGDNIDWFPRNSLLAARLCLIGLDQGWGKAFAKQVFQAQFANGQDISDLAILAPLIVAAGGRTRKAFAAAQTPENKIRLRVNVERAEQLQIFGAPTFMVDNEPFWGNDRLEDAIDWALTG